MPPRLSDFTNAELQRHQTLDLMRMLSAKTFGGADPAGYFAETWPRALHRGIVTTHFEDAPFQHAVVTVGSTTGADWAAPLMAPSLLAGFVPLVKAASVLGKLPVTPAPFNTKIAKQLTGSSTTWVGEGAPKPVSKHTYGNVTLPASKCSSIIVVTSELMRLTAPESATQLQTTIKDEVSVFTDKEFLGTAAAVPNVRPAGILNGVAPITPTASLAADLATLVNTFFTNRPNALAPYVVCSPATASKIAALDMGRAVTVNGGTVLGLPVVTSPGAGANCIVVDAPVVHVADGGLDLDITPDAMLEMVDNPAGPTAATVMVSLWQDDLVGIRCERFIHWVVAAANAVQFLAVA